jgi:hypothetical protein
MGAGMKEESRENILFALFVFMFFIAAVLILLADTKFTCPSFVQKIEASGGKP